MDQQQLFSKASGIGGPAPLAERMRPRDLEELIGQEEITGPSTTLFAAIEKDQIGSLILWGPPGSGKTTLCGRLALKYKNDGRSPLLVSTDFERVAASEQLKVLGEQIDVPVWVEEKEAPAAEVAKRAMKDAERTGANKSAAMRGEAAGQPIMMKRN